MSIKLDDLLNEVKPPPQALDLGNTEMFTKAQFLAAYSKVPEYRMRSEKVRPEEVTGEGPGGWKGRTGDPHVGEYADSLPPSMRGLQLDEFYQVNIDWRMLTTARPANKLEEEVFSRFRRYVDLGRAQLERVRQEANEATELERIVKVVPGRGSLPEVRIPTCRSCLEELCQGVCDDYMYEHYARTQPDKKQEEEDEGGSDADEELEEKKKKKKKRRRRKRKPKKGVAEEGSGDEGDED